MRLIKILLSFLNPKTRLASRRRLTYDSLRKAILAQHNLGFSALNLKTIKVDLTDLCAFKLPMYRVGITPKSEPMLIWDPKMMTEEIGFKPSEVTYGTEESPSENLS